MKKIVLGLLLLIMPLFINANDLIIKTTPFGVDQTISKIENALKKYKGINIFTIIDHQAGAKKAGLKLNEEKVIIFGNPKLGTLLMLKDPKAGLDLPLKILVYKDNNQKTKIVYRDPQKWKKGFDLEGCKLINKMVKVLNEVTIEVSK